MSEQQFKPSRAVDSYPGEVWWPITSFIVSMGLAFLLLHSGILGSLSRGWQVAVAIGAWIGFTALILFSLSAGFHLYYKLRK